MNNTSEAQLGKEYCIGAFSLEFIIHGTRMIAVSRLPVCPPVIFLLGEAYAMDGDGLRSRLVGRPLGRDELKSSKSKSKSRNLRLQS